jgi:hypothetical protein
MVLNPSDSSDSSVNVLDLMFHGHNQQVHEHNVLQVGVVQHAMGPVLPPDMIWHWLFDNMLPQLLSKNVLVSLQSISLHWAKRYWDSAFSMQVTWNSSQDSQQCSVQPLLNLHDAMDQPQKKTLMPRRRVSRALNFDQNSSSELEAQPVFSASPVQSCRKKRAKKTQAPLVHQSSRRFTRSCLKLGGYRPTPLTDSQPKPKKRMRAKKIILDSASESDLSFGVGSDDGMQQEHEAETIPKTPIKILQNVGVALGISPEKLTEEQLEADPKDVNTSKKT